VTTIQVKDAAGATIYIEGTGAGTSGDPFRPLNGVTLAAAVPAGTNNIGDVDVASALPAGDNNIGNVDVVTAPGVYAEAATTDPANGIVVFHRTASRGLRPASATDPLNVDGGSPVIGAASDALACDTFRNAAVTNTAVAAKTSPGTLYGYHVANSGASAAWCQFYDVAQGSVTVGTTTPKLSLLVPAGACLDAPSVVPGIAFGVAITVGASTTAAGGTAPSTALAVNLILK
jgi:hypothetical protein